MKHDKVIIGVGGNISNTEGVHPINICDKAVNILNDYKVFIEKQSKWYLSDPIPKSLQPKYFNKVIIARSNLNEFQILKVLHEVENMFGRIRKKTNEARTIDLDLIDCFGTILDKKNIILPHPRAHLRRFVIEPLAEINGDWIHPIYKIKVTEILKNLNYQNLQILNNIN